MYLSSKEIYDKLVTDGITNQQGDITLKFMGVDAPIVDKSAIGNLLQEWLSYWLIQEDIEFRVKLNTQEFPDFLLHPTKDNIDLLEIKTFDNEKSPNFDVANFDAYRRSLLQSAYRLDADYLIFAYQLDRLGNLTIPRIWLKKVWEITGNSARYPVKCQVKQDMIYNIRPITWYSTNITFKPFSSRLAFLQALYQTIALYDSQAIADEWLRQVTTMYVEQVGHPA